MLICLCSILHAGLSASQVFVVSVFLAFVASVFLVLQSVVSVSLVLVCILVSIVSVFLGFGLAAFVFGCACVFVVLLILRCKITIFFSHTQARKICFSTYFRNFSLFISKQSVLNPYYLERYTIPLPFHLTFRNLSKTNTQKPTTLNNLYVQLKPQNSK